MKYLQVEGGRGMPSVNIINQINVCINNVEKGSVGGSKAGSQQLISNYGNKKVYREFALIDNP
jgi:hypothetical protein